MVDDITDSAGKHARNDEDNVRRRYESVKLSRFFTKNSSMRLVLPDTEFDTPVRRPLSQSMVEKR